MKKVTDNANHLKSMLQQLEWLAAGSGRVQIVANSKVLMEMAAKVGVKLPLVGVVYEGFRALGGNKVGASGEMVYSTILITEVSTLSYQTQEPLAVAAQQQLDEMREAIQGTMPPSGHLWKLVLEAPIDTKNSVAIWLQRWSTPVAMTPKKAIGSTS